MSKQTLQTALRIMWVRRNRGNIAQRMQTRALIARTISNLR